MALAATTSVRCCAAETAHATPRDDDAVRSFGELLYEPAAD
jgi:hypothetical protein